MAAQGPLRAGAVEVALRLRNSAAQLNLLHLQRDLRSSRSILLLLDRARFRSKRRGVGRARKFFQLPGEIRDGKHYTGHMETAVLLRTNVADLIGDEVRMRGETVVVDVIFHPEDPRGLHELRIQINQPVVPIF